MPRRLLAASGLVAASLVGALVAPAAPAGANPRHSSVGAVKQCASPSSTGAKPSKYNRTPKGHGPWHVPRDPCNTEGLGSSGATPYYNCAYWAAEKRPDVWVDAVWKYGYSQQNPGAWRVRIDARRAGFPINHHPRAGDVAAWPRSATMGVSRTGVTYVASPGGHVAYVEKVLKHGRIKLSSMGQASNGGITTTIKFRRAKTFFIHHK
jgi:surface antigen